MSKNVNLASERTGLEKINNEGYKMKILKYDNYSNVIVEFQDKYMAQVHTGFKCFQNGTVENPYHTKLFGVGITGNKYPIHYIDACQKKKATKEYQTWHSMIRRCYDEKYKYNTYIEAKVCDEWKIYDNFYEWLHSQENFNQWINIKRSALDKDIIHKGNKIYSPDNCCLVTHEINSLFTKSDSVRGDLPIGVSANNGRGKNYIAYCNYNKKHVHLGCYDTLEAAFYSYKKYKEDLIKRIAQEEYKKGTITKRCYEAMMNYEVEITD